MLIIIIWLIIGFRVQGLGSRIIIMAWLIVNEYNHNNEYKNTTTNLHKNTTTNAHKNTTTNAHKNTTTNAHTNTTTNEHNCTTSNDHKNTTTNEHKKSTTNVHNNTNMSTNHIIIFHYCKTNNIIFQICNMNVHDNI